MSACGAIHSRRAYLVSIDSISRIHKCDGQRAAPQTVALARSRAGRAGARPNHSITGYWGLVALDRSNLI